MSATALLLIRARGLIRDLIALREIHEMTPTSTRVCDEGKALVAEIDARPLSDLSDDGNPLRQTLEYAYRRIREGCVSDAAQAMAEALNADDESVSGPSAAQADDILGKPHYNT